MRIASHSRRANPNSWMARSTSSTARGTLLVLRAERSYLEGEARKGMRMDHVRRKPRLMWRGKEEGRGGIRGGFEMG